MDNLDKAIYILTQYKTNDIETKRQIKKAIKLINDGLDFEESYKEYIESEKVSRTDKLDLCIDGSKDIPF